MKLEEVARKSIEIIKESGSDGVTTEELSRRLSIPKRRLYDVKAIMKAANLISTFRDRTGTKIYWNFANERSSKQINHIRAHKIRVSTSGLITNVSNKGTEVIIECSYPSLSIEAIN
ncbi:MAG: hypothetical protein IH840_14775 [Candidatus Heimdallarchaeota archaeon]|nr:hypothetical protein [Candidatus Heimdallarchaeota archaeon]